MTVEHLASVLAALAVVFPKDVTPELVEVYALALADLSDAELSRAADQAVKRERFFPVPAVLRDYGRPDAPDEAMLALARAVRCAEYTPRGGTCWSRNRIATEVSEAAAMAFVAIGSSSAFALLDDPFHGPALRRAFASAYRDVVRAEPATAFPVVPAQHAVAENVIDLSRRIGRGMP